MPSAAHDAWLKSALGVDAAAAGPGTSLPAPGPGQQSQTFHQQFQAALAPIREAVAYVAANAEATVGTTLSGKADGLVPAYTGAAQQIDPADENKAKSAISQALARVQAAASEATKAKADAEKALNDWKAHEPKGEEADTQVAEMTDWGHPKAPPLRAPLDAVLAQATAKKYKEACTALDAYLPTVQPVWDDYQKQKAAQAEYDPAKAALDPRLTKAQTTTYKTLEPMQKELQPGQADMEKDATAKNYVDALAKQKALTTKVDAYEKAFEELEAKKKAFDDAKAEAQPKLDAAKSVDHPKLAPMQQDLATGQTAMDQAGEAEDFDKGTATAKELSSKADEFDKAVKELEQQKKDYEAALATLQPRLDACSQCQYKTLAPLQEELSKQASAMADLAKAEDYAGALKACTDLGTHVDDFEKQIKELEEKKKAYEDKRQALDPKLQAMSQGTPPKKLEADKKAIDDAVPVMEKAAADEDYDTAQTSADDIGTKADKYETDAKDIDDKKQQYEDAMAKIQPTLDAINETRTDGLATQQQAILTAVDDIKKQVEDEDYEGALTATDTLSRMLDEYKKSDVWLVKIDGKEYYGTKEELEAIKVTIAQAVVKAQLPPIEARAGGAEDGFNFLRDLNNKQYVIAWVCEALGGADLNAVSGLIDAHKASIAAARAAPPDVEALRAVLQKATDDVNASNTGLSNYLAKLDIGGSRAITALQFVEVTCFAIAAACGGAILAPEGASILVSMGGNAVATGGFKGLQALAEGGAPAAFGDKVDYTKLGDKVSHAMVEGAIEGAMEGGLKAAIKPVVEARLIAKMGINNPIVAKKVEEYVTTRLTMIAKNAAKKLPDLLSGKKTVGDFANDVANEAEKEAEADQLADTIKGFAKP